MANFFDTSIEFLKGVGSQRAAFLQKELKLFSFGDLLQHYPFRYEDRTKFYAISEVDETMPYVQLKGKFLAFKIVGEYHKKRLIGKFTDGKSEIEMVWFQRIEWVTQRVKTQIEYVTFGRPTRFGNKLNIVHPEIELTSEVNAKGNSFQPIYSISEKLRARFIDSKFIAKLQTELFKIAEPHIRETLPDYLIKEYGLVSKKEALKDIHFPKTQEQLWAAQQRLKFEELFYIQLRLIKMKLVRQEKFVGQIFHNTNRLALFYKEHLPFELTPAQKRVIREIYTDMKSGKQMNRLLQGDVGSGKTMVAFLCMLIVLGGDAQATLMAPTAILAQQHFFTLKKYADLMGIEIGLLTGSVKKSQRKTMHEKLQSGAMKILIGTHALLEEEVKFQKLGLVVIDEQHRFGVAQRSKLWEKNAAVYPHILVMTATPIPRTLAMTLYGDLEISVIDELPQGRKPIVTTHQFDSNRLKVNGFIKKHILAGRQVYIVYPLIEESEKLDLKHLLDGYESITRSFPDVAISMVHGQMKSAAKDFEMARFVKGETKIMLATTVIEVGVDVPNASVMIIESAERFGLSQLHQLRGRVGRGAVQSYCILMTSYQLSTDTKTRIDTMVKTNDGFEIAETDLKLRGPGDLVGTQQSGVPDLLIADLSKDGKILQQARDAASKILTVDPELKKSENAAIKTQIELTKKTKLNWSRIS